MDWPDGAGFFQIVRHGGKWERRADFQHQFLERETVFAAMNRVRLCADHFHAVTFERAVFMQRHRGIERGLAAECRSKTSLPFAPRRFISSFSRTMISPRIPA